MDPSRDWWRPDSTARARLLAPLAWLYGGLTALRRTLYRRGILEPVRLPVPVVVVGNLTVGGSGKTPLVIHLAQALAARGWRPGVISRGYGANADTPREVREDSAPGESGDEPLLIRRRTGCPVTIGADRVAAGRALLAAHPEVDLLIADDGLQHLRLARDFSIAVFDDRLAGNGRLLPAGPLREPLAGLDNVDAVVINGTAPFAHPALRMHLAPGDFRQLRGGRTCPAARFAAEHGVGTVAIAGIGHPERFFATLARLGLTVRGYAFPDHHAYTRADLAAIDASAILATEKDALKCEAFDDPRLWVVPVTAEVDPALVDAVMENIGGSQTA